MQSLKDLASMVFEKEPTLKCIFVVVVCFSNEQYVSYFPCDHQKRWNSPDLLEALNNPMKFQVNRTKTLFVSAVTLACGQRHWKWYEQVKINDYHAKFNIHHIYGVRENGNVKVFATPDNHPAAGPNWLSHRLTFFMWVNKRIFRKHLYQCWIFCNKAGVFINVGHDISKSDMMTTNFYCVHVFVHGTLHNHTHTHTHTHTHARARARARTHTIIIIIIEKPVIFVRLSLNQGHYCPHSISPS